MNCKCEVYRQALATISKIIDTLPYECSGRQYTLSDEDMSWVVYCREIADKILIDEKE